MAKKISEFFMHLMAYGGINFEKGILYVWNSPNLLIPTESFARFQHGIEEELGKDGQDLFYWMGWVGGRNSVLTLSKKYGISEKDIPEFVKGVTQDGFASYNLEQLNLTSYSGLIKGSNCEFAEVYKKIFGKSKYPIDNYILGAFVGGSEALMNFSVSGFESKCVAKGDDFCCFELHKSDKQKKISVFNHLNLDLELIKSKSLKLYTSRENKFSLLKVKDIHFGDGSFVFRGLKGVIVEVHLFGIIHFALLNKIPKKYDRILRNFCSSVINNLKTEEVGSISSDMLNKSLQSLNSLGFGEYICKYFSSKKILINNENNPLMKEIRYIFGLNKIDVDSISRYLLEAFLLKVLKRKVIIKEKTCLYHGAQKCFFDISLD